MSKAISGAEILLECLYKEGVEVFFGYPGGVLLGFYDKVFDSRFLHVLPRHEQGGIHAAEGYARASGKVGVCMATSGPGATNLVTGIADAYMDSVPLVVFTGQVPTSLIGGDAFQEADIIGITRPIVKHSYLVQSVHELSSIIKEAFHIAKTGRPGPVVVDLPKDVLADKAVFSYRSGIQLAGYNPKIEGHILQVKKSLKLIETSKRPLIIVGGGVSHSYASKDVIELSQRLNIPVVSTFMGLGCFPSDHENFVGCMGMHGKYAANMAVSRSDCLIAIGVRFSDRSTGRLDGFAKDAKIIHVDIDPASISKNVRIDIPIVGDVRVVVRQMLSILDKYDWSKESEDRGKWQMKISYWDEEHPLTYKKSDTVIKPQYVIEKLYEVTGGEAIITTEVGQNQMWSAQFYKFKHPRRFISSGGLGTMGFGFPAAIGAKLALPDVEVVDIAGDGSIQMNIQELATAVQYRLGVKIVILNNRFLGMVRQWQGMFFNNRYSYTCLECQPDFVKLAESYGCVGLRAEKPSEVVPVLEEAFKTGDRPVVMDFVVDREENVLPMVAPGAALDEMILK